MRADNRGEGGILALMSLIGANGLHGKSARRLTVMGLLGAALIYGDGVITPAISVLSALEGVNVVTATFKPYVMPMAVGVLIALFAAQRFGTESIGRAFGPVMLLWFLVIAVLGARRHRAPPGACLLAIDPRHAIAFLAHAGGAGMACARRRVPVHHGRRSALRRHGAFRQRPDAHVLVRRSCCRRCC